MIAERSIPSGEPALAPLPQKQAPERKRHGARRAWKVLVIEDDPDDVFLVRSSLKEEHGPLGDRFNVAVQGTIAGGLEYLLAAPVDVAVLDLALPDSTGLAGLARVRAARPELPIVVLTGQDDELLAVRALQEGAQDYIPKSQLGMVLLTRSLRHAIERKHAELAVMASEARYRQLLETASEGVWTFDVDGIIDYANPRIMEMLGHAQPDLIGRPIEELVVPFQRSVLRELLASCISGERVSHELSVFRSDGSELCAKMSCNPLRDSAGTVVGTLACFTDLTERFEAERVLREREQELREAQKLEAVGQLAGGIAHDFNNMLTVIASYTEMVLASPGLDPVIAADLAEVAGAADRAGRLTRQLMSFTRKRLAQHEVIDLASVVSGASGLLRPLAGESRTVRLHILEPVPPIFADSRQLEQVLVNLVSNARDAMPDGGAIDIRVSRLVVTADHAGSTLPEGDFVLLEVTDTGCGIRPEIMDKIFEPFFTTKMPGSGTGLGLASVYGIVGQAGGHVWCRSEVGKGSSFFLAFPAHAGLQPAPATPPPAVAAPAAGSERILLIDDDAAVRAVTAKVLVTNGYSVLSPSSALEALDVLEKVDGAVDLVITDLVMPDLSGPEIAAAVSGTYPHVRIVYMSGYSSMDMWKQALTQRHDAFLEKPFTPERLLSTVRTVFAGLSEGV